KGTARKNMQRVGFTSWTRQFKSGATYGPARGRKAWQVVWSASLRACAREALTTKRLAADNSTDLVAVDVNVAAMNSLSDRLHAGRDARMQTKGQAITRSIDRLDHLWKTIGLEGGNVQDWAEDFFGHILDAIDLENGW